MTEKFLFTLSLLFLFSACGHGKVTNYEYWEIKLSQEKGDIDEMFVKEILIKYRFKKEWRCDDGEDIELYVNSEHKDQRIFIFKQINNLFIGAILYKPAFYQSRDPKFVFSEIISKAKEDKKILVSPIGIKENVDPKIEPKWAHPNRGNKVRSQHSTLTTNPTPLRSAESSSNSESSNP